MKNTTTLLHIDASPRGSRSRSRSLGRDFLAEWQKAHPEGRIVHQDLGHEPPPFVTESWVEGAFTPADQQSPGARAAIAVSDGYVNNLLAADLLVITTPIYNLSVPAALKAWIDQIVRIGRTVALGAAGFQGLVHGKKVVILVASGGDFRLSSPSGTYNFVEPYLRAVLGFIGITDVRFIYAHSQNQAEATSTQAYQEAQAELQQLARSAA
ncbi:MAG: FMN-dependent NADH-azoreductase [Opitutales bacterium]